MRLVFDTSTKSLFLGIGSQGKWRHRGNFQDEKYQQSQLLFSILEEKLKEWNIRPKDILEIAVGQGPGSYTGLRIGFTVAKVWSFSKQIPLYVFSSQKLFPLNDAQSPSLKEEDFERIQDINQLTPIYQNDHFV